MSLLKEETIHNIIKREWVSLRNNANTFRWFFSSLRDSLLQQIPRSENKFGIKQIPNDCEDFFFLHNEDITTVGKVLKNLNVVKPSGIDQISAKFFNKGAAVIAIHLVNIKNQSVKIDHFLPKCKHDT